MESLNLLSSKTPGIVKVIKQQYSEISNNTLFSKNARFKLNHNYGALKQLFIKCTITTTGPFNAPQPIDPFTPFLLSNISLKTDTSTLQKITPLYTLARLSQLNGTSLYTKMTNNVTNGTLYQGGIAALGPLGAGGFTSIVLHLPLFFFFSDDANAPLDMHGRKQLYIEITENSQSGMGLPNNANTLQTSFYELISVFEQRESYGVPRPILKSYDIFIEDTQTIAATAASVRFRLRCPYDVFAVSFILLKGVALEQPVILSFKIETPTSTLFDMSYNINYLLSDDPNIGSNTAGGAVTIPLGSCRFSQNMSPSFLTLTFAAPTDNCTLYTLSQHRTSLKDTNGTLNYEITGVF